MRRAAANLSGWPLLVLITIPEVRLGGSHGSTGRLRDDLVRRGVCFPLLGFSVPQCLNLCRHWSPKRKQVQRRQLQWLQALATQHRGSSRPRIGGFRDPAISDVGIVGSSNTETTKSAKGIGIGVSCNVEKADIDWQA